MFAKLNEAFARIKPFGIRGTTIFAMEKQILQRTGCLFASITDRPSARLLTSLFAQSEKHSTFCLQN
jgi:hypothetical protein